MTAKAPAASTPAKQNDVTNSETAATGTESTSSAQPEASQTTPAEAKPETLATDTSAPMTTQTVADSINPVNYLLPLITETPAVTSTTETPAAASTTEVPVSQTTTLFGGIADAINPLSLLSSFIPTATATPNQTEKTSADSIETENLREVGTSAPALSGLTESVLNIAQGKPATLRPQAEKTVQSDAINDELAADLSSLFNINDKTTVETAVNMQVVDDLLAELDIDDDMQLLEGSINHDQVNELMNMFEADNSEQEVINEDVRNLLDDFEVSDNDSDAEADLSTVGALLNDFVVDESAILASDVLSGVQQDVVDSLLADFIETKSPSHNLNADLSLTQSAPLVSGTLKTAIGNLHIAQEHYELANANKLLADQAVERNAALKTAAQHQVETATAYADSFKEVAYTSRTAKFFDFGAPTDPQEAVRWAQDKAHHASEYLGNKVSEYSQILFKDKSHSITEVKQFLADTISSTEILLEQTRTEFAPLVETYEASKAAMWFGAMRAPYPAGYIEKQAQIKTYSDQLDQYNTAQTEILAVEKAVDAWEQLVGAHQQLATADRLYTHSIEQQQIAIEQVTLTKGPFESAQAEVTRLQEAGHDQTVANTEHHDSTHPITIATAPAQTIVEQHTAAFIEHHI